MTNNDRTDGAILENQVTPDHRPGFWADLELAFEESALAQPAGHARTQELPAAGPTDAVEAVSPVVDDLAVRRADRGDPVGDTAGDGNGRRIWPMAAAAALIALVGIGFLATRNPTNPTLTTDLVAGTTEAEADIVPLDGPVDEAADGAVADPEVDADADAGADSASADSSSDSTTSSAAADPTPAAVLQPAFEVAAGADGAPAYFALDGGLPAGATFLANSSRYALTWWAIPGDDCNDANYSSLRYVNGSGLTQDVSEPDLGFSGDVSHFTVGADHAAWVVSCGNQLELWVASVATTGRLERAQLVWFGTGQPQNALMLWADSEVSLSLLGASGTPFSIEYETADGTATRNGRPTRFQQESGTREHRSTPVAVSADGTLSYWPGVSDQGQGECAGSFGRAGTLWLRRLTTDAIPVWEPALADETRLGEVTAVAIEPDFSQVAFADTCADSESRVFVATQRADGQLSNLREIDLGPYVPGFADALYWIDSETLRIHTDNSQYGFDLVRLELRLDDGRENGVIVQLD